MTTQRYIARAHFVTECAGSFQWLRGLKRGYYRVDLIDTTLPHKSDRWSDAAVVITYSYRRGIDGVTERSAYYIDDLGREARAVAARCNALLRHARFCADRRVRLSRVLRRARREANA
jgi:hypothetical protein